MSVTIRRRGYKCVECNATTWIRPGDQFRAARMRCSGCGSLYLEYVGRGVGGGRGDVVKSLAASRTPGKRRNSWKETATAASRGVAWSPWPEQKAMSPDERAAAHTAYLRQRREDYLARKKHGLLKPELRRPPKANS